MDTSTIQTLVAQSKRIVPQGAGSKTALRERGTDVTLLDLRPLRGILEYDPGEFTFTALAGTPVSEVETALAEHGQYLPFDPPLTAQGATLGGTIAAGLSGPGRQRYGGVRDFLIGVRFVDGKGQLVRGGGKVVKNAAGFDFPKLMVGSLGRLGILVEVSFKVFPRPHSYTTLSVAHASLQAAVTNISKLATSTFDIEALELDPLDHTLFVRLGGLPSSFATRLDRLRTLLGGGEVLQDTQEGDVWQQARQFAWLPAGCALVKVPTNLHKIATLEAVLDQATPRRYSAGGNLAWIGWHGDLAHLHSLLEQQQLAGLLVLAGRLPNSLGTARLGIRQGDAFLQRIKAALDPENKFGE